MGSSIILVVPTTTSPVRVTRLRKLPATVGQATMTLVGSSVALPVSARYSDFVRAPMGPIERSSGHGAWKLEVSASLDVGESWNLGVFLAHALKAHSRLQEKQNDASDQSVQTVWATGAVDVIDLRILQVGHIESKARQALAADIAPDLLLLPPENLGDVPEDVRAELEARGTRIVAPATMAEALEELDLPSDWAKDAAPELAGWRGSPYRGLEAYEAEHRPIFFGRGCARAEALELLRARAERETALLVIHGKSGVGKSSLAMAGLLDDVVEKVPGRAPFGTATIRFGGSAAPLALLRDGFAHALGLEDSGVLSAGSAAEWMEAWPANGDPRTMLLILDQLEQGLLADEADVAAFGEALATLVKTGRVWVIATLRSDRIDLLERAPALVTMADGDGLYRLVRPTLAELGEIIRAPSKLAGITFEEGEGERLLDLLAQEAMSAPDSLPLLQVTLMRLAEQRDAQGRVNMRDYERIGGFSGAVERLADETVRNIEDAGIDPNVVDRALATLVRIDPETDRVDARVIDPDMQPAEVGRVLEALVEARLATASTLGETYDTAANGQGAETKGSSDSGRRVRLAHETLIREWPRLRDLAARLRTELALRDRLEEEALRWEQDGRPNGDLLSNTARLTAAEELIAGGLAAPSPQACLYVEASHAEVERQAEEKQAAKTKERQGTIRRRIAIAAALVAVVVIGMAGLLVNQAQQTQADQQLAEAQLEAAKQAEQLTEAATDAQRSAEEQLEQAQITESALLTEKGSLAFERADFTSAIALAYSGLPHDEELSERPVIPETERLLRESLARNRLRGRLDLRETPYDGFDAPVSVTFDSAKSIGSDIIVSRVDGLHVLSGEDGLREVAYVEGLSGTSMCILEGRFAVALSTPGSASPYDEQLQGLLLIDLETKEGAAIALPGPPQALACNDAHARVYFILQGGRVGHFDPRTRNWSLFRIMRPDETGRALVVPSISPNGRPRDQYSVADLLSSDDGSAFRIGLQNRSGDWACAVERPLGEDEVLDCVGAGYDASDTWPHLSRGGRYALTVSRGILDFETGETRSYPFSYIDFSLGFFRTDARDLIIGFSQADIRVLDVDTMESLLTVPVDVDAAGRYPKSIKQWEDHGLVAATVGGLLRVLRIDTSEVSEIWQRELESGFNHVLLSEDGRRLATVNLTSQTVSVLDSSNGKVIVEFKLPQTVPQDIYRLSFDGSSLIQLGKDGWVQEWAIGVAGQSFASASPAPLAYATYLPNLEGFVASSREGLLFLGNTKSINFDNPSLHQEQVMDNSAWADIQLAMKYPNHEPMILNDGTSWLRRVGVNAFMSAGSAGGPSLWSLEGNRFEHMILDLEGGPPLQYLRAVGEQPALLDGSVSPDGTHAMVTKWNNEGDCLFDLQSATLIECYRLPASALKRWIGRDFYILYGLPSRDPRRDQGYRYATRIISTAALAFEEPKEVLHKSLTLPIDGTHWVTILRSGYWYAIQDVLVGGLDNQESTGFPFKAVRFIESLAQDLMNEQKLFVGGRLFLPFVPVGASSIESAQIAAIDIAESQVTCALDFDFETRTTPVLEPTPDPDVFIIGARAELVNVQTCELLETLNPTKNPALAVHITDRRMSLLLGDGSIIQRHLYPTLATVVEEARSVVENSQ